MKTTRRFILSSLLLVALGCHAATVQQFQPQGKVADQTRATVRFSADMVKLGEPDAAPPFAIDCAGIAGEGRWIDSRAWAWQMSRALQPGERCVFTIRSGLATANGEAISGKNRFEYFGAAPRPWRLQPGPGSAIEEDQAFVINGGGPLAAKSLADNL